MSVRPILLWPDPRLSQTCAPAEGDVSALVADLFETMYDAPGRGLAAPQIGVMRRLAVVDCSEGGARAPVRLANPELIETSSGTRDHDEASPNLPGVSARVTRPALAKVRYLDEGGAIVERWVEGLWATSVQHQIDHLNGMVFVDRLSRVKRKMVLDRFAKLRKRG